MSPVKAVIFDMYETLVSNPQESWIEVFEDICRSQSLAVEPAELYREWKALEMGFRRTRLNLEEPEKSPPFKSYETAWRDCFVEVFPAMGLEGDAATAAKATIISMGEREAFEEVPQAIADLQKRWVTAVLSNADDDYLLPQLKNLGLSFPVVLSSEMVGAYKPHPLPFQRVLEELGIMPHEAVYVGDNPFDDVKGAKGVGMGAVWINRYGLEADEGLPSPDHQVKSLAELEQILERWD